MKTLLLCTVLFTSLAWADDDIVVKSPHGKVQYLIGVTIQDDSPEHMPRLAYRVWHDGKLAVDTSFLGYLVNSQGSILGEKPGLIGSEQKTVAGDVPYTLLRAEYLQNGSLGSRVDIEARIYDDGVAFRYHIPVTPVLEKMFIENELTEFVLAEDAQSAKGTLSQMAEGARMPVPYRGEIPGIGAITITEAGRKDYPPVTLEHGSGTFLGTELERRKDNPVLSIVGNAPLTSPWRVILFGDGSRTLEALAR